MVTLVLGADAFDRLTRNLTVELEEFVSYCGQDLDLTETTWERHKEIKQLQSATLSQNEQ